MFVPFLSFSDPCHSPSELRGASAAGLPPGWDRGAGVFTQKQFGVSFQQKCVGLLCAGNVVRTCAYIFLDVTADSSAHTDVRNHIFVHRRSFVLLFQQMSDNFNSFPFLGVDLPLNHPAVYPNMWTRCLQITFGAC